MDLGAKRGYHGRAGLPAADWSRRRNDPRIGIVGPMVYHHNEPTSSNPPVGGLEAAGKSLHVPRTRRTAANLRVRAVDWISGCAILVRRAVIEQFGMLDERFFYYWEEAEWCLRARGPAGRSSMLPAAKLWHKGVQRDYRPKPSVAYYNTRNRLLMLAKHRAPARVWPEHWYNTRSWSATPFGPSGATGDDRDAIARGMLDFMYRRWGRGTI